MRKIWHYAADIETLADVISQPKWNEETIAERANWIAAKAIEIWPSYLPEEEEETITETTGSGNLKLSLNGGAYVSMSRFVLDVVRTYMSKHPDATYTQLKGVFHDKLCCKGYRFKGLLCTEEEYNAWDNKLKPKRYMPDGPDRRLCSADNTVFFVNTQWTQDGINNIIKIAKAEGIKVTIKTPDPSLFNE